MSDTSESTYRLKEFSNYLKMKGAEAAARSYPSQIRRAASMLGISLNPQTIPNKGALRPLYLELGELCDSDSKFYQLTSALDRYAEFIQSEKDVSTRSKIEHQDPASLQPLPSKGRKLLQAIVEYTEKNETTLERPESFPTYSEMYRSVFPQAPAKLVRVGGLLRKEGLDELNEWTLINASLPRVTGLIVNKQSGRPGPGFSREVNGEDQFDRDWWVEEVKRSLAFDWTPFIGKQKENSPIFPSEDLAPEDLTEHSRTEVSRIIRDSVIVRKVKKLHNYTCQICRTQLELRQDEFYSEAHHLKPLGAPHNGPDIISNLICVCPTCHVKLDYGVIQIDASTILSVKGHNIAQKYIEYHNNLCH